MTIMSVYKEALDGISTAARARRDARKEVVRAEKHLSQHSRRQSVPPGPTWCEQRVREIEHRKYVHFCESKGRQPTFGELGDILQEAKVEYTTQWAAWVELYRQAHASREELCHQAHSALSAARDKLRAAEDALNVARERLRQMHRAAQVIQSAWRLIINCPEYMLCR